MPCQFLVAAWHVDTKPLQSCSVSVIPFPGDHPFPRGMRIPGEHDKSSPLVRLDDLPHECLEFKYRVRDVEDRQEPRVALVVERKVFHHAGDFGIAMLRLVLFPANLSRRTNPMLLRSRKASRSAAQFQLDVWSF